MPTFARSSRQPEDTKSSTAATRPDGAAIGRVGRRGRSGALLRWARHVVAIVLLPVMIGLSLDFGATWDERNRQVIGEKALEYVLGRRDLAIYGTDPGMLKYYPGTLDVLCVLVQRVVPADPYVVRHVINAVLAWIGIVVTGWLAARLFENVAGLLAIVFLAVSPRFFADAMNNSSDAPFAVVMIAGAASIATLTADPPFLRWKHAAVFTLIASFAVGVRAGGLLLIGYLGIALLFRTIVARAWQPGRLVALALRVGVVTVGVLLLGSVFWPWAQERPLTGPIEGLRILSSFSSGVSTLYRGEMIPATDIPWDYIPGWLSITTPPVVLVGAVLSLLWVRRTEARSAVLGLWGMVLFPPLWVMVSHATLYDGIRHLLFIYPPLVVLSAAGWARLATDARVRVRTSVALLVAIGVLEPLVFQARNHPNQCVYFNALVGGPRGAFGRFELDFWGNSVLQAVAWGDDLARRSGLVLVIAGHPRSVILPDVGRFRAVATAPLHRIRHHLEVILLRGQPEVISHAANRRDVMYRVLTADGTPLCVVVPGPKLGEVRRRLASFPGSNLQAVD